MDGMTLLFFLLPVAFAHGYWTGRHYGIETGAERMFQAIWKNGTPVSGKADTRTIELTNDSE